MATNPGTAPRAPSPDTLPPGAPPGRPASGPDSPSAMGSAPRFGGLRGGRPRKDGLVPGSPEALEADRNKDRQRKEAARAVARKLVEPQPLPSADGPAGPPAGDGSARPVNTADTVESLIAWVPDDIRPMLDELLPLLEEEAVQRRSTRATEARLPAKLVAEIAKDSKWPQGAKIGLSRGGAEVLAKWMNTFGIDARNKSEVILGLALIHLFVHGAQVDRRMNKIIEAQIGQPKEVTQ